MTFKNIFKTLFFIYFQTVNQMNKGLDRTDLLLSEDRLVANDFPIWNSAAKEHGMNHMNLSLFSSILI